MHNREQEIYLGKHKTFAKKKFGCIIILRKKNYGKSLPIHLKLEKSTKRQK